MTEYLVIREGSKWADVFRLVEGETVTVGRAPTNKVVILDERCSRNHAEIFSASGKWVLRDLDSRNGTTVAGERVLKDRTLEPGDIIHIGSSRLAYVSEISQAFPDSSAMLNRTKLEQAAAQKGAWADSVDEESVLSGINEPTTITHRTGKTRFLAPSDEQEKTLETPKVGRAAAKLCKLAFELAKSADKKSLANLALNGLFEGTHADSGAVLICPLGPSNSKKKETLEVVASRSDTRHSYHRVSPFLADTVMRDGQAVLARNVMDDSQLGNRDSKGDILASSVICAPIRIEGNILGIVHLYSTDSSQSMDPDDLEFTLAVADTVAVAVENLSQRQRLAENLHLVRDENVQLRERLEVNSELVGSSPQMMEIAREISRAAPTRATVLIRGESGVGKELVARAVHFSSPRRKKPFVCINCAALTESLLESELFGHEQGAFTGATERKMGKFEAAHRGTLMLDEIGEMSPSVQAKFLRVLEGHPFERVGGSKAIQVDVRVIGATNRDLEKDVAEGAFRRDLYFRLHVLEINVPPLRKRPQDIIELADYFLARFNKETGRRLQGYTDAARMAMQQYRWPGNVRELKNVVERAVVLTRGNIVDAADLALTTLKTSGDTEAGLQALAYQAYQPVSLSEIEREHILATLNSTGWNKSKSAKILGIERSTLDRKIRRYELAALRPR